MLSPDEARAARKQEEAAEADRLHTFIEPVIKEFLTGRKKPVYVLPGANVVVKRAKHVNSDDYYLVVYVSTKYPMLLESLRRQLSQYNPQPARSINSGYGSKRAQGLDGFYINLP